MRKIENEKKYIFVEDIWISGVLDGREIIGRTTKSEGLEVVSYLTEDGKFGIVKFDNIIEPKRLVTLIEQRKNEIINQINVLIA